MKPNQIYKKLLLISINFSLFLFFNFILINFTYAELGVPKNVDVLTGHPNKLFYEGAVFPDAKRCPISKPAIILWYGQNNPIAFYDGIDFRNTAMETHVDSQFDKIYEGWKESAPNSLLLARSYIKKGHLIRNGYINSNENPSEAIYNKLFLNDRLNRGYLGISIDEFQGKISENKNHFFSAIRVIEKIKIKRPDFFVHAWLAGPLWIKELNNSFISINIISPEAYLCEDCPNPNTNRTIPDRVGTYINQMRRFGLTEKTVMGLSIYEYSNNSIPSPVFFEHQLQYLRSNCPECPGVAIYKITNLSSKSIKEYIRIVNKYYIDLAPTVKILKPEKGDIIKGIFKIEAIGIPNNKSKRRIAKYRFFIDNVCVNISDKNSYYFDSQLLGVNEHLITVHAVDDNFLAGAAQVYVNK